MIVDFAGEGGRNLAEIKVTYLEHSGFAVQIAENLLVFDYYRDPAGKMPELLARAKRVFVFSSHKHGDHFVNSIAAWQDKSSYILSDDIAKGGGLPEVGAEKIIYCKPYQMFELEKLRITTFGSTDAGVSFLVEVGGFRIFHAGDLNRWHWTGESEKERRLADADWQRELAKLYGREFDLAFFPLDQRLGEYRDAGAWEFCRALKVGLLAAMHSNGEPWQAPDGFPASVWSPQQAGEEISINK